GTGAVSDAVKASLDAYTTGTVTRLSGSDRYTTAVAISKASFGTPANVLYIATGASFPDALAGAPVAGDRGAPLLLVTQSAIPSSVKTELTRLKPKAIVILGGTGAVSDAVKVALAAYLVP
ncbi:MAG: cell wall-binding repeat-containing protein, partial [Candidatus Limnocylindrales bacterium]